MAFGRKYSWNPRMVGWLNDQDWSDWLVAAESALSPLGWLQWTTSDMNISSSLSLRLSHGWRSISSILNRSPGGIRRQDSIRFWHSGLRSRLYPSLALQICSSFSKGMSPQTMSYSRIPRDQTVRGSALYCWFLIHSGGEYTRVPESNINIKEKNINRTMKFLLL